MAEDFRTEARISMNKLAEYAGAVSAVRRQNIVRDQIRVTAFKSARYTEGRRAITRFIVRPSDSVRQLLGEAARIRDLVPTFAVDDDRRKFCMESARAIESFALIAERIRTTKLLAVAGQRDADMMIAGVRVLVAPDTYFLEPATERPVGALKLHFSKTYPLDTEGLRYAATLLHAYLRQAGESPRSGACIAVDVLTREFEEAPRATTKRVKVLEAACREIAAMWPVLLAQMEAAAAEQEADEE